MKLISENTESTVVTKYEHKPSQRNAYQTEEQLENALIAQLQNQGYEFLDIHTEKELADNMRIQLEKLNDIRFTDNEWQGFFKLKIANGGASVEDKTALLQDDRTAQLQFPREDNSGWQNVKLIDKRNIFENKLQVIHQYTPTEGKRRTRYDVTILVNGLPMVHIELKRRGVQIREAFNQIKRYSNDSFWADNGLFDYIQLFVISNGSDTKYYSNTTRDRAARENRKATNKATDEQIHKSTKRSDSFEFTSYWADSQNNVIRDLDDFTATFFAKHSLLNILTRYCVFTAERELMVMRPYQIAATEAILQHIRISTNHRQLGTVDAGGYIWHTTGSGKTLTSFKTAQLCTQLDYVDKVLFVVDRKDLDYQTVKEYEKFKKGSVSSNRSTTVLTRQMGNDEDRIIVTTIQKLNSFCKKEYHHPVYGKHVVIIFDECHRSQFGDMHNLIVKRFQRYHIFGFTGTPIFPENAVNRLFTTEKIFGKRLHTYTVISAIADNNVLPFRVEYIKTMESKSGIPDQQIRDIDRERALLAPERIHIIVEYVLQHFDQKTMRNHVYRLKDKRVSGFNSIFATASIEAARLYYEEFRRQQEILPEDKRLKIALIYSYGINEDDVEEGGLLTEEDSDSTSQLDQTSRDFLDNAIKDYNAFFGCSFDTSAERFPNYYKDVSERMKKRELDMLIVVNMFLTGFDATTLNTLWVDKNLKMHGLLQAFSRTNRILNSIKDCGNIVCFRNLEEATNESFALFGDKDAAGVVLMRPFEDYYYGYDDEKGKHILGYKEIVDDLLAKYALPLNPLNFTLEEKKEFVKLIGGVLKLQNLLSAFDEFTPDKTIVSDFDMQDYLTWYNNLHEELRKPSDKEKESIEDDLVFEMELVKQIQINIPYILQLVKQYHDENCQDKTIIAKIQKAIGSSPDLRNKRDLIMQFIDRMTPQGGKDIADEWNEYVDRQCEQELEDIIKEEKLNPEETRKFMDQAFDDGYVTTTGVAITKVLPPMPLFGSGINREVKKNAVLEKLQTFFSKFFGLFGGVFGKKKMVLYPQVEETLDIHKAAEKEENY